MRNNYQLVFVSTDESGCSRAKVVKAVVNCRSGKMGFIALARDREKIDVALNQWCDHW